MIGLDTNVLVRYLAQDDAAQAARSARLIDEELTATAPGFVGLLLLVEVCWVLQRLYAATPAEVVDTVRDLTALPQLRIERREVVQAALRAAVDAAGKPKRKFGFVDALIAQVALAEGCTRIVTFDKAAVKGAGMALLEV